MPECKATNCAKGHGKHAYGYHACRCETCRKANADYMMDYRHRTGRSKKYQRRDGEQ